MNQQLSRSYGLPSANLNEISTLSAEAEMNGVNPGDIILAVGANLHGLNGLGAFCTLNGTLMRLFGAWPLVLLQVVSIVVTLAVIAKYTDDFFTWAKNKFGGILTILMAISGVAGIGWLAYKYLASDEEEQAHDAKSMSIAALKGFIIGLLPSPIQGAVMAVAVDIGGNMGIGPGSAPPPAIVSREEEPISSPQPARRTEEQDGEELDANTISSVADALGVTQDEVYDAIARS